MTPAPPHGRSRLAEAARIWAAWSAGAATILGACLWCGCTVTPDNYATLSFFFDGVPDPRVTGGPGGDATIALEVVVHAPYAEENCEACHRTNYRPSRNDPGPCLSCHESLKDEHRWTHGAVAGGACLWCHAPHESARKWLLRGPDRNICIQCHTATPLVSTSVPAHMDPTASCLECHYGHGGDDSLMLKPGATAEGAPPPDQSGAPYAEPEAGPASPADSPPAKAPNSPDGPNDPKEPT